MGTGKKKKLWYAVYCRSRAEKKAALELEQERINYYLPLVKTLKQWSDRKKWVEEPLFRSYIFVQIDEADYYKVLKNPHLVRYVTFEGKAVPIPEKQIEAIRIYLGEQEPVLPDEIELKKGQKVEVITGKLTGLQGELIDIKGKSKLKVRIDVIGKSIVVHIPKSKLRIIQDH
jgi:transcription antitermination factor NusG